MRRTGRRVAFLFVDLDRFKNINDTLGHEVGDELIRQVADRLQQSLRVSDTLARLGGDEFVVMLPDSAAPRMPMWSPRRSCSCSNDRSASVTAVSSSTCSIGVATAPDHGQDYTTLLRHADAAMYEAKQAGRNITVVYTPAAMTSQRRRLELESDLHTAVEARRDACSLPAADRPQDLTVWSASRRWCAGIIPSLAAWRPTGSSPWPRSPA